MSNLSYKPNYAIHPGTYLAEILEARDIKKKDIAERIGISEKHLNQLINKQTTINTALALKLERVLGVSASIWINLAHRYSIHQMKLKEIEEIKKKSNWIREFPLKILKNYGIVKDEKDIGKVLEDLLIFFSVSSIEQWDKYYNKHLEVFYRKSQNMADIKYLATWLRMGEVLSNNIEVANYNQEAFKSVLKDIRKLIKYDKIDFQCIQSLCAKAGVAVIYLKNFGFISGSAHWLSPHRALIVLSDKFKRMDQFWFTFFHESAHILYHKKKNIYIDDDNSDETCELEANRIASNFLIPEKEYKDFVAKGDYSIKSIVAFANKIDITTDIIIGRLQHDQIIPFNRYQEYKRQLIVSE